ncbi:Ran-binding-domain-containing protein [Xylona heveae TC161]|uniref:Ran-binding-domain-containing protein n=1 Tax=Xylona heveae (strain CBS 132557 / TC161) TaxID=1328760 RepID=A0A165FIA1_XYLHT|nr:Ran-binding-domain-containing protein [Xylona heveae TC161]KZF21009.1 Ran-binding-domain-containing protein [Xylona heveae TC161]
MDIFLGKITQQAMNYAIRSGITITSTYAIRQCSRLLRNVKGNEREELGALQDRLESKIRIISPAIDMIELIAARGNTSLESAVSLTKALRWDIQNLGLRLANAAAAEERARRGSRSASRAQNELEVQLIIRDIRKLLNRIEDAVPLINLAITTSGASLSTSLPSTISPSRLLQASTFLTAGDTQYAMSSARASQIGPAFTLSMYMLFSGHTYRPLDEEGIRETTWKEVIHKARVKLLRVPLNATQDLPSTASNDTDQYQNREGGNASASHIAGDARADEFAYQLLIIEDLDDDRVHTLEDDDAQPGPYEDVRLAGIREVVPIHEISKIFYADTGKILNIGSDEESNNPILLLKRDIHAVPPRRMMERVAVETDWRDDYSEPDTAEGEEKYSSFGDPEQSELDAQLLREEEEASAPPHDDQEEYPHLKPDPWRLPANLDPEWIAFEVYSEATDSDTESEPPASDTNQPASPRPSRQSREQSLDPSLTSALSALQLGVSSPPPATPTGTNKSELIPTPHSASPSRTTLPPPRTPPQTNRSPLPPIRTSLSLLETLIRLTSLQQFQQTSHLAINDELLNFFLQESSTTGAGSDTDARRRARQDARRRVGFDPYDESPVKRRGEDYQAHPAHYSRGNTPYDDGEWEGQYSQYVQESLPQTPPPLFLQQRRHSSRSTTPERYGGSGGGGALPSYSRYIPPPSSSSPADRAKGRQAALRRDTRHIVKQSSPLGRHSPESSPTRLPTSEEP